MKDKVLKYLEDKHLCDAQYIVDYDDDEKRENGIEKEHIKELTKLMKDSDLAVFDWKEVDDMANWIAKSAKKYRYYYNVDHNSDAYVIVATNYVIPNATMLGGDLDG